MTRDVCHCSQDPWDWKGWPRARKACPRCGHTRDEHIPDVVTNACERRPCTRQLGANGVKPLALA